MLLLITVMCVIAEKKRQLNSARLYVVVIFIIGGILIGGARAPWAPRWLRLCSVESFEVLKHGTQGSSGLFCWV